MDLFRHWGVRYGLDVFSVVPCGTAKKAEHASSLYYRCGRELPHLRNHELGEEAW